MNPICVRVTNTYGALAIYPADNTAGAFLSITGRKTFKASDLARARELGLTVLVDGTERDVCKVEHAIASDTELWRKAGKEPTLEPLP